jgi:hypothetical protein
MVNGKVDVPEVFRELETEKEAPAANPLSRMIPEK